MRLFATILFICLVSLGSAFQTRSRFVSRSLNLNMVDKPVAEKLGITEIVEIIRASTGIMKEDVELVLSALTETIHNEVLVGGKEMRMHDLGIFKQKISAARVGRNPRTGEKLQISGSKSVSFSVSSSLKIKDTPADPQASVEKAAKVKAPAKAAAAKKAK